MYSPRSVRSSSPSQLYDLRSQDHVPVSSQTADALIAVFAASQGPLIVEGILSLYLAYFRNILEGERSFPLSERATDGPVQLSRFPAHTSKNTPSRFPTVALALPPSVALQTDSPSANTAMSKKRRSLQSLFSPASAFLQVSLPDAPATPNRSRASSRSRSRSSSAATTSTQDSPSSSHCSSISSLPGLPLLKPPVTPPRDSPPPDLLDDDPFANLSPAPSTRRRPRPPSLNLTGIDAFPIADDTRSLPPRSPLGVDLAASDALSSTPSLASLPDVFSAEPSTPSKRSRFRMPRRKSSSNGPAYTRPAFPPRPSLPSLSTLARSHVPVPKVRKGRVGAQLPAEPWNDSEGEPSSPPSVSTSPEGRRRNRHLRRPTLCTIRDSRMVLDGQPWYVNDGSPEHGNAVLVNDPIADSHSVFAGTDVADEDISVPPPLRSQTDPFPRRLDSPPSSIPSLCPSSPTSSFSSVDHSIQPNTPRTDTFPASDPRHTRYFNSELAQSLEYDYADALSQLSGPPSPETGILQYFSPESAEPADFFKPGTSADTVRTLSIEAAARPISDDHELPRSPDSSTFSFSSAEASTSSSGHSRCSSRSASTDYGEELAPVSPRQRLRVSAFGIPWPSFKRNTHTPPLSCYTEYKLFDTDPSAAATADDVTERISAQHSARSSYYYNDSDVDYSEPVDGEDSMHRSRTYGGSGASGYNGRYGGGSNGSASGGGYGGLSSSFGGNGGAGGGRRGGGDGDRYRQPPSAATASSESESSEEEEESSDDDDYRTARTATSRGSRGSQDDDVPLAQQIPNALKAQHTIRRQVRDEISQRRRDRQQTIRRERDETIRDEHRTLRAQSPNAAHEALARTASDKARAAAAESSSGRTLSGTSRMPAQATQDSPRPTGRPRTKTLPSNGSTPISIGDLTKKLLGVQTSGVLPAVISKSRRPSVEKAPAGKPLSRDGSPARAMGTTRSASLHRNATRSSKPEQDDGRGWPLRPMRSFHRPNAVPPADAIRGPPLPKVGSPVHNAFSNKLQEAFAVVNAVPAVPLLPEEHRALERAKSSRQASRRPSIEPERPRLPSLERESPRGRRPSEAGPSNPAHAVSAPVAPPSTARSAAQAKPHQLWQQRIHIGTMQQYVVVEIGPATSAGEILQLVDAQGALSGGAGEGSYMIWEVAQDFGMERPIRSFELLADICNAWHSDKMLLNLLVIKRTLLSSLLSRSNLPRSSPLHGGYVQHEYKRGKWQKRWLELREHSLWLSKREGGKDNVFLCSLNNFDAFYVIRPYKGASTKGYCWTVKSTDSLTFFENTADYLHAFQSNSEAEGKAWIEKILLARSYVLYQERNVISTSAGAALTRATTRAGQRPVQPLVHVGASKSEMPTAVPVGFEPGSLLAKRLAA